MEIVNNKLSSVDTKSGICTYFIAREIKEEESMQTSL
jgi:hypothetical protein